MSLSVPYTHAQLSYRLRMSNCVRRWFEQYVEFTKRKTVTSHALHQVMRSKIFSCYPLKQIPRASSFPQDDVFRQKNVELKEESMNKLLLFSDKQSNM